MYKLNTDLQKFSVKEIPDLQNKRIVLRACLNVAVDKEGKVIDATRIDESIKTIKYLAENAKQVTILAHLGRPESYSKELSFWNVHQVLQEKLGQEIEFVLFQNSPKNLEAKIILGDNIRFFKEEESKDPDTRMNFAKDLAQFGEVFVNDAFADYRESASTYDIAKILPSYLGYKFIEEVEALSKFSNAANLVSVLGGAKLSEKLDALKALAEISEKVVIGGAMAYTLLKAKGVNIGNSLYEEDKLSLAKEILNNYENKLVLPVDHLIASEFNEVASKSAHVTLDEQVPDNTVAIDIGSKTTELFVQTISGAKNILWNGPMGVFEWETSAAGTLAVGKAISQNSSAYKLAGGGDSIAAINKLGLTGFNHISTGGGAMLAFIAYNEFPTLDVVINQ